MFDFLQKQGTAIELSTLVVELADAIKKISENIVKTSSGKVGTHNSFGEEQAALDLRAEEIIQEHLKVCPPVRAFASEELDELAELNENGKFIVAYDPLDGSSLIDVNFAMGTIVGIYGTNELLGRTGRDQVAAIYAIYGPRTLLVFSTGKGAHEFTLVNGVWELTAENLKLEGGKNKYFAPGNLRAAKEREDYLELVNSFIKEGYTLRYSGGMVPDIHHSFVKGHGIFMYPGSPAAPQGKLRLLFECAPMAFIAEQAGGAASNGKVDILDIRIESIHQQSPILIGTKEEVQRAALALN
mgnify:CR=1 FL=1